MRKRKIMLLLIAVSLVQARLYSQAPEIDIRLPELLPASPEASGFVKAGYGSANFSTGAVSVNIPLYTLRVKNISWPLSISYSSQGVKVDETTSRVGYGWTLSAGGMITRTVRDNPDELADPISEPANLGAADSANFWYCKSITDESNTWDSQPDDYHFNFNGYSGKFVFDTLGNAVVTSHSNLKIERIAEGHFMITTTDGVKYKFGYQDYEKTSSYNFNIAANFMNNIKTVFFLYRVEIPGGEWINFSYTPITTQATTGITQTFSMNTGVVHDVCLICPISNSNYASFNWSSVTNKVEYDTRYISSITTSNGLTVNFSYEDRPDQSDDKRMRYITVLYGSRTLKHYKFTYYDPSGFDGLQNTPDGTIGIIGRFFLTKLTDKEYPDNTELVSTDTLNHDYIFDYIDLANTPEPISTKQDHFGFYNGNTGTLLPYDNHFPGTWSYLNGNREVNHDLTMKGMLRSITYPTGGKEEFFYEGNTVAGTEPAPFGPVTIEIEGNYQGSGTHYSIFSSNFTVPYTQTVNVILGSSYTGGGSPPVGRVVQYYIKEDNDTIYHNWLEGNSSFETIKTLYSGKTYRLEIKIQSDYNNAGLMRLEYDTTQNPVYYDVNIPTGGVRLRKIKYTTPENATAHHKFFRYSSLDNLSLTSGIGNTANYYYSQSKQGILCTQQGFLGVTSLCNYSVLSSNTSYNIFNLNGSHIFYRKVIESDDSLFANGGTEYTFYDPDPASTAMVILGADVPNMPIDNYGTLSGQLFRTRQFDKNLNIVSEQKINYDTVYPSGKTVYAVYVRKNWEPTEAPPYNDEMEAYDIIRYHYRDVWYRKRSDVSKSYASNNISSYDSTIYMYGTDVNVLPAEVSSINSRGDTLKTVLKYPTDYTGITPLTQMVSYNMIGELVETFSYKNSALQQQKKIKFKNWNSGNYVIKPDTIQVKASPAASLKDELYFEKYDSSGNILQARKVNDVPVSYIWDHKKTFPVAEIKNATYDRVAYAGFEGEALGNWKYGSGNYHTDTAFAGKRSFSGTLYDTISIAGTYIITLWTAAAPAYVNSQAGTLLRTVNGWGLYRWTLTNPTNIAVTGNYLDELRLYPSEALISSYSYEPFVGVIAKSDVNNEVLHYQYDPFNRLKMIRDIDSNILKLYRYRYLDTITVCTDTTSQWVNTGNTRCIKNSNNNNTGVEEAEQKNMNWCSPGYLVIRWVSLGTTGNCPPVANCTGADKRVVNGVCETGVKVYTSTVLISPGNWECTYHYEFSDGYWTQDYIEYSETLCGGEV